MENQIKKENSTRDVWLRIVQVHALLINYTDEEDTRLLLKLPQALAFIPEEDVYDAFNLIKQKTGTNGKLVQFYDYVEDTFVGKVVQKKVGGVRGVKYLSEYKAPLFEINLWNVNKRISECLFSSSTLNSIASQGNRESMVPIEEVDKMRSAYNFLMIQQREMILNLKNQLDDRKDEKTKIATDKEDILPKGYVTIEEFYVMQKALINSIKDNRMGSQPIHRSQHIFRGLQEEDIEEWLYTLNTNFEISKIRDEEKVAHAAAFVRGRAPEIKQTGTMEDFVDRFLYLIEKLGPSYDEKFKITWFLKKIDSNIYEKIGFRNFKTLDVAEDDPIEVNYAACFKRTNNAICYYCGKPGHIAAQRYKAKIEKQNGLYKKNLIVNRRKQTPYHSSRSQSHESIRNYKKKNEESKVKTRKPKLSQVRKSQDSTEFSRWI
ncbi:unnamed protein product [Brachionus calyciflorus]|uniref:CCHC-type domain-containing protein n=1 Tax=Brachionus calyciflorus TaxID=104777 RepID=A0A813V2J7_9BILA|nr:unnamed protein product [Brachionus calyciflorus]